MAYILFVIVKNRQQVANADVLKSFQKKYPKASYVTWKTLQHNIWVASFLRHNREQKAYFEVDGRWLKTWTPIPLGNVPKEVSNGFYQDANFRAYERTFQLDTPQGIYYEFITHAQHPAEIIRFDIHGKLVEKRNA